MRVVVVVVLGPGVVVWVGVEPPLVPVVVVPGGGFVPVAGGSVVGGWVVGVPVVGGSVAGGAVVGGSVEGGSVVGGSVVGGTVVGGRVVVSRTSGHRGGSLDFGRGDLDHRIGRAGGLLPLGDAGGRQCQEQTSPRHGCRDTATTGPLLSARTGPHLTSHRSIPL